MFCIKWVILWRKRRASGAQGVELKEMRKRHREYLKRSSANQPRVFPRFYGGTGTAVGPRVTLRHPRTHDQRGHAADAVMTDLVLRDGVKANAYRTVLSIQDADGWTTVTIQPIWVDFVYHLTTKTGRPLCRFNVNSCWHWPDGHVATRTVEEANCEVCTLIASSAAA